MQNLLAGFPWGITVPDATVGGLGILGIGFLISAGQEKVSCSARIGRFLGGLISLGLAVAVAWFSWG